MDLSYLVPFVSDLIGGAAKQYPLVVSALVVIGASRAIMKPLMSLLKTIAEQTSTPKDNELLEQVEQSKVYKAFIYVTDYLLSIKLK